MAMESEPASSQPRAVAARLKQTQAQLQAHYPNFDLHDEWTAAQEEPRFGGVGEGALAAAAAGGGSPVSDAPPPQGATWSVDGARFPAFIH